MIGFARVRPMLTETSALPRRRVVAGLPAWFGLAMAADVPPAQPDGASPETLLPPAQAEVPPDRVTSDSAEFCAQLSDHLSQHLREHLAVPVSDEVRTLGQEGHKMCQEGHLRPGILRLRRALQILRGEETDPH